jgi:hypothetical protein
MTSVQRHSRSLLARVAVLVLAACGARLTNARLKGDSSMNHAQAPDLGRRLLIENASHNKRGNR